jgi:GTP-binding protein Era
MKAAFVSIVGRPSSGKSTLLNRICDKKVAIVSPVPQTTRNKVRGIYNSPDGASQLVFIDTPGYHESEKSFNKHLIKVVLSTMDECDLVLSLTDASRKIGAEDEALLSLVKRSGKPVIAAINKIDAGKNFEDEAMERISAVLPKAKVFRISALKGDGVSELLLGLSEASPEGERMYPEEFYTDQPPDFRIAEIIREKAMNNTREEVPHSIYVEIEDLEMIEEGNVLWARGFIYVERESQKGILVGKNGDMIRRILSEAQADLDPLFPYEIELDIRVKVKPNWRNDEKLVRKMLE